MKARTQTGYERSDAITDVYRISTEDLTHMYRSSKGPTRCLGILIVPISLSRRRSGSALATMKFHGCQNWRNPISKCMCESSQNYVAMLLPDA